MHTIPKSVVHSGENKMPRTRTGMRMLSSELSTGKMNDPLRREAKTAEYVKEKPHSITLTMVALKHPGLET